MADSIVCVAILVAKPGKSEALEALLRGVVTKTRTEQGVIDYDLHRDLKDPRRLVFVESWENQQVLDNHNATEHMQALFAQLPELIEHSEISFCSKII